MPERRYTAEQEIVNRIKELDAEESLWRGKASRAKVEHDVCVAEADKIANARTTYQYALAALKTPALVTQ
jgi:hypothetical protein